MPDQILHQAVLVADIKMVARFVQKQDRRVLQQGADDVGTLLFTARKPARDAGFFTFRGRLKIYTRANKRFSDGLSF